MGGSLVRHNGEVANTRVRSYAPLYTFSGCTPIVDYTSRRSS